ncbi:MAG: hypothetical protein ACJAZO_004904 [Myxococcota bacterium]|jgi:hypothetical protein
MVVGRNDNVELGASSSSEVVQDIGSTRTRVHKPGRAVRLVDDETVTLAHV